MKVLGIDMAWGDKMPDAIAEVQMDVDGRILIGGCHYGHGDEHLRGILSGEGAVLIVVDAPMICINEQGARPVDLECSRLFRVYEAGCHPVNLKLCSRPLRVAEMLSSMGYKHDWRLGQRAVMEVYPHPAMVRFFRLEKTIKYKKGRVAEKRREFHRYQRLFSAWVAEHWRDAQWSAEFHRVLTEPWTKEMEDRLDAYLCAFIGLWHLKYNGSRSEVLGDLETGFMVLPVVD